MSKPRKKSESGAAAARAELRPVVRETMQMASGRRWPVAALAALLRAEFDAAPEEVLEALRWNQSKGFVDYIFNAEFERDEWFLTERGRGV